MLGYLYEFEVMVDEEYESRFIDLCKKHDVTLLSWKKNMQNYATIAHGSPSYQCSVTGLNYDSFIKEVRNTSDIYITIIKS